MIQDKWLNRYFELAELVAGWSKDPSTRVGAVLIGKDRRNIAIGYNGFPHGVADTPERLADREVKYAFTQHAERNALDNATFDLAGATLVTTMHPCAECAKSIVQKGVVVVICPLAPEREPWKRSSDWAAALFLETGVELQVVTPAKRMNK